MGSNTIRRMGYFFSFVGILLIGLFILSDLAKQPTCGFLAVGAPALALGIFMIVSTPATPGPKAERFRTMRRMTSKPPDKQSKK